MAVIYSVTKNDLYEDSIIPKVLKAGSKIKIKHYSTFDTVNAGIWSINGNKIIIELPQKLLENNVMLGDSVVCAFFHEDAGYVLNGEVEDITLMVPNKATIRVENVEKCKNMRSQTRYSVSLSANVREKDSKEVHFAVVRNISLLGASFTCNAEFDESSEVTLNIAASKDMVITFYGRIIRSRRLLNYYEYGVIQTSIDELNGEELEKYIQALQAEEESLFAESTAE